jgi:hypothetical protein
MLDNTNGRECDVMAVVSISLPYLISQNPNPWLTPVLQRSSCRNASRCEKSTNLTYEASVDHQESKLRWPVDRDELERLGHLDNRDDVRIDSKERHGLLH